MSVSNAASSGHRPCIAIIAMPPDNPSQSAELQTARARFEGAMKQLGSAGYDIVPCFISPSNTQPLTDGLRSRSVDGVVVASVLRSQAAHTELLERVVNEVHSSAPQARFIFPESPELVLQAIHRHFPPQGQTQSQKQ